MAWFENCYARLLVDNHISEDDPSYMTKFDPRSYVAMVKKAQVDSAMVYACCHNGNCYYPTKIGNMHKNLAGRDIFGETIDLLNSEGIVPIAYYTVIVHNDSAKNHPDWRMEDCHGDQHQTRYWFSCPNNPGYRAFAREQIAEVISYDIAGIFIDMTFWQGVCVCHNCRSRYMEETGSEIPLKLDWGREEWVAFQRTRERWVAEFAHELTSSVREARPELTVTHNFSPVLHGWWFGQSPAIATAGDYAGGDFYGGRHQQSLGTKVFASLSTGLPFEFMTSRCVNLCDHTSMKSEDEMFCHAALTLANGGAYFFIDAINPDGTLSEDVYQRLGRVAERIKPFKTRMQETKPAIIADVGLYFSMPSHVDDRQNGRDLKDADGGMTNMAISTDFPPVRELLGASRVLSSAHIPYKIVSSSKPDLRGLRAVIVNNAAFMSEDEVEILRAFVRDGGTLIATGLTSLFDLSGGTDGDFQLKDVFGVSYSGKRSRRMSYLAFRGEAESLPSESGENRHEMQYVVCDVPAPLVTSTTAAVLAEVYDTCTDPDDPEHYASIHSNPPGPATGYHALTVNRFGKGKCIYIYSALLAILDHSHRKFGEMLFRRYTHSELILESNAPHCVEITLLKSHDAENYLLCFVNYQQEMPNIPVHDISAAIHLPDGVKPLSCRRISDRGEMAFEFQSGTVTVELPSLSTIEVLEFQVGVNS